MNISNEYEEMVFNKPKKNGLFHQVKVDARSNGKENWNNWRRSHPYPIGGKSAKHKKRGLKAMPKESIYFIKNVITNNDA